MAEQLTFEKLAKSVFFLIHFFTPKHFIPNLDFWGELMATFLLNTYIFGVKYQSNLV